MITREDALKLINSNTSEGKPVVFEIEFFTWNESRQTGGKLIKLPNCVRTGHKSNMNANGTINVRQVNSNYHPANIHIWLIHKVNGEKIIP